MRPKSVLNHRHRLPRGGNRCDFCGCRFVHKLYACQNFLWEGRAIFTKPVGRWAACDACGIIIDAGKWPALVNRVMAEVRKRKGLTREQLPEMRRDLRVFYVLLQANLTQDRTFTVMQARVIRVQNLC